jgi:sugar lactone lactonase YvrE
MVSRKPSSRDPDERTTRFNDIIADPEGRVFCGTMPTPDGRLGRPTAWIRMEL